MKTNIKLFKLILFVLMVTSCKKGPDCITSTGKIIKEIRELNKFKTIILHDNINLILTDSASSFITVEGGENLISEISTSVNAEQLMIRNNNKCNWARDYSIPVNIYIGLPTVSEIFHYGYGEIASSRAMHLEALNIHFYGAGKLDLNLHAKYTWISNDFVGDFRISGSSEKVECSTYKLGRVDLSKFLTRSMIMNSNGEADSYVQCDGIITGKITGNGNVYYSGNATINAVKTGQGSFVKN